MNTSSVLPEKLPPIRPISFANLSTGSASSLVAVAILAAFKSLNVRILKLARLFSFGISCADSVANFNSMWCQCMLVWLHVAEGGDPDVGHECIMVPESPKLGVRELKGHLHDAQGQRIMISKTCPPHSNRGTNAHPWQCSLRACGA